MEFNFKTYGLMAVAALALSGCAKEPAGNAVENEGVSFMFEALEPETKTAIDGLATSWAEGDGMAVFHAPAGTYEYGANDQFTVTAENLESGTFTGTLATPLEAGKSYDWYAVYPHRAIASPAASGTPAVYFNIGNKDNLIQNGNGSTSHLAGGYCPVYGVVRNHPSAEALSIPMRHLVSCVRIDVANTSDKPLYVTSVSFTSDEDIVGGYDLDITGDEVVYIGVQDATSAEAVLYVSGAEVVAAGATASYYIPLKPHVTHSGKVSVNGYEKSFALDAEVEFKAGTIKKLTFNYDRSDDYTGEYLMVNESKTKAALPWATGTNDNNLKSMDITADSEGRIADIPGIENCKMTLKRVESGVYEGLYTIEDASSTPETPAFLYAAGTPDGTNLLRSYPELDENGYWAVAHAPGGTWAIVAVKSAAKGTRIRYNESNSRFNCFPGGNRPVILYSYSEIAKVPQIIVMEASKSVGASATSVEFEYELKNMTGTPTTTVSSASTMANVRAAAGPASVTVTFDANTSADEKRAEITLSYEGAEDVVITVVQASADSGEPYQWTLYNGDKNNKPSWNNAYTAGTMTWTASKDGDGNILVGTETAGLQFGNNQKYFKGMALKGTGYTGGIKKVVVNTSWKELEGSRLVSVTVGGTAMNAPSSLALTGSPADYVFTSDTALTGDIEITWTNVDGNGAAIATAIFVKQIAIN